MQNQEDNEKELLKNIEKVATKGARCSIRNVSTDCFSSIAGI